MKPELVDLSCFKHFGVGDPFTDAFIKVNNNFNEVYRPRVIAGTQTSILGDSNTDNADDITSSFAGRNQTAPITWLRQLLLGKINLPQNRNYGVSGSTFASNINNGNLARAVNDESELVIIALGVNDIGSMSSDTIISNINQYVNALRYKTILFLGIHPSINVTAVQRQEGYQINKYLASLAATNANIFFANPTKYLVDQTSATGAPKAGMLYDQVHFSTYGAYFAALAMKEAIEQFLKPIEFLSYNPEDLYTLANPTGNMLTNAMLLGSGGTGSGSNGFTGNVPDGWAVNGAGVTRGSAACALSAIDKDTAGKHIQMALSGTPGSPYAHRVTQSQNGVTGVPYQARVGYEIDANAANLQGMSLTLYDNGTPNFNALDGSPNLGYEIPSVSGIIKGVLETPIIIKGPGSATMQLLLQAHVKNGAATNATVRFNNPEWRRLD